MFQKSLLALAMAGTVVLVGCGGSSGNSGGTTSPPPVGPTSRNDVSGPLDPVQEPVSSQVLAPLSVAAAGTPLAAVLTCVDQIVVGDALDVVDVLAAQLDANAGAPNFDSSAATVQAEVTNLISDLQRLLTATAGGGGCSGSSIPVPTGFGTNPLAGTPLEDFGATVLSTLTTVQAQLSGSGGSPSLDTLSSALTQLSTGYQLALAQLPTEATGAPVLGPSLALVGTTLTDLRTTLTAAAAGNPTTTGTAITNTVTHLLEGVLVDVLPVAELEDASGQNGAISGPIADALAQLSAALAGGFATPGANLGGSTLTDEFAGVLAPLTDPASDSDPTVVLFTLLSQIEDAFGSGLFGTLPIADVGSTQLDAALAEITTLLDGASNPESPLAPLVTTLTDLLGSLLP